MFDSQLYRKLSLTAAVLGFLTAAACSDQPATVASHRSVQAASKASSSGATSAAAINPAADPATASPGSSATDPAGATQPLHLVTLPKGTKITATVRQSLDTDKNRWGDAFSASLVRPVKVDGKTVLPRGTVITGRITRVRTHELKVALSSVVVDGINCDLDTNSRRPSDREPKPVNLEQRKDNSTLSARTRLTFKLSKPAKIPAKS
ncbi:MAG TPA: hypothetical protein VJN89_11240 [Candidatus Acidoferrum sp.]|nr:hypothetical protein [Candidatus Acidoferrum sp.]